MDNEIKYSSDDGRPYVGSGQHSHEVPARDGVIVFVGDSNHQGTELYWSERRNEYVAVSLDGDTVQSAERLILVRGESIDDSPHECFACDLDSPDGLVFFGLSMDERVCLSDGAEVLWDSATAPVEVAA